MDDAFNSLLNSCIYESSVDRVSVENDTYRVEILLNHQIYYILKSQPHYPVPAGEWMGFWDPDIQEVVGLSKRQYDKLDSQKRMEADAQVQLKKYVDIEFWDLYACEYLSDEWSSWWKSGGSELSQSKGIAAANQYWKERLNKYNSVKSFFGDVSHRCPTEEALNERNEYVRGSRNPNS